MTSRMRSLCVLLLGATACSSPGQQQPARTAVITIGQVIDRTGSIATPSWADSIRLAAGTANEALKQAGRTDVRFEIAEENSGNSPELARAGALELVQKSGAKALITDSSQDDIAVNMLAYDGDPSHLLSVPVVCMACTSPNINNPAAQTADPVQQAALRNGGRWNFRTTMSDAYQARMLAHWLGSLGTRGDVNGDGKFKLAVYASDDPYGHGFSDSLKARVLELSPSASIEQIFHDVKASPADYDWTADVARLTDKRNETSSKADGQPDAVVTMSFPKFEISFTKAWVDSKTKVRLVHTHNFRAARVLEALGPAVEDAEGTSQAVLGEGISASVFSDDLKKLNGQPPAFRDAAAYDAAMTLMLATLQAAQKNALKDVSQVTGAQIREAMWMVNDRMGEPVDAGIAGFAQAVRLISQGRSIDYRGASGPCDFDAHGNVVTQLAHFRVEQGHFVDMEKFDCGSEGECRKLTTLGSR
jgi:branched-chain amino acid transport system substrate-binding protein